MIHHNEIQALRYGKEMSKCFYHKYSIYQMPCGGYRVVNGEAMVNDKLIAQYENGKLTLNVDF